MLQVPIIEAFNPFVHFNRMMPTQSMQLRNIRQFTHRPVRFGRIKYDITRKTDLFTDQGSHFPDGEFLSCTYINMCIPDIAGSRTDIGKIDLFHHIDGSVCHLFAPKELTERFACAP